MNSLLLLPAFLAASPAVLHANGGGYLQGIKSTGPFRPVNVDSVEMVSEKLDIELQRDAAVVSIVYQLHNPGNAVTVEMGFPCSVAVKSEYAGEGRERTIAPLPQLEGFVLTADGKPVKSKLTKDHATLSSGGADDGGGVYESAIVTGWQVVELPFAAAQTRTVAVSYRNPYYRAVSYMSNNTDKSAPKMRYLFSAAALWKGPIKFGGVTVRATGVDPGVVSLSHSGRFKRDGNQWTWAFSDFEPTLQDDLEIVAGEHEFSQWQRIEEGTAGGSYVMRGKSPDRKELQKSGKWFFIGRQYTATASSSLKPDGVITYGPENLNDTDWDDAWVEGAEGDGIGESLMLIMKKPQKATRLLFQNGYRKDKNLYQQNNRVKKLGISVNGGTPFSVKLPDGYDSECAVDLPPDTPPLETVKLTIEDVYRGTMFRDTCLTTVEVEVPLSKAPVIRPSR